MTLSIAASLGMFFIGVILGFSVACMYGIAKTYSENENLNEN